MPKEMAKVVVNSTSLLCPSSAKDWSHSDVAINVPITQIVTAIRIYIFSAATTLLSFGCESAFRSWLPIGIVIILETTIRGRPRDIVLLY